MMADENILSRSPSPTLYEFLGIPTEEIFSIPDDIDPTHERGITTPDSNTHQEAPKPTQSLCTTDEDEAIRFMLQAGICPEQIVRFAEIHKKSKEAGNHAALDIISGVQIDELLGRIHTVEARLILTGPSLQTVPPPTTIPVSTKLKREPSEDFEEKLDFSSKRARTTIMNEEPDLSARPKPKHLPEPKKITRRGCPGEHWKCKPDELTKRTYWTSFSKFRKHFETHHLEHNLTNDYRWECHLCVQGPFGGNGHGLIQHLWDHHF